MRPVVRKRRSLFLLAAIGLLCTASAGKTAPATQLIFPPYQIKLQTENQKPIALNEHTVLIVELQKLDAAVQDVESFKFDAHMPEHKHGMVTKAKISKLAPLKYKVEGVRLHMPGKWVFDFDVSYAGGESRISSSYNLN
jgi:hypothetical protein